MKAYGIAGLLATALLAGLGTAFAMAPGPIVETSTFTVTTTVTTTPPPPPAASDRLGFAHPARLYSDAENAVHYAKMKPLAGFIRTDFGWGTLEPVKGSPNWTETDRVMAGAAAAGMKVLAILNGTPPWSWSIADYGVFCRRVVERYPALGMIEVQNEPDLNGLDASTYANMLRVCSAAVKAARPDVITVGNDAVGRAFFEAVVNLGPYPELDKWSTHPYPEPKLSDVLTATDEWSFYGKLKGRRDFTVARGQAKPFWVTELGASTTADCHEGYWCGGDGGSGAVSEAQQARRLVQMRDRCLVEWGAWCERFVLYMYRDPNPNRADYEANFGLLRFDGSAKPAWDALSPAQRYSPPSS